MTFTLEQTKSTNVGSSSPMYSMIFLLIQGRTRRSINVCGARNDKGLVLEEDSNDFYITGPSKPRLRVMN